MYITKKISQFDTILSYLILFFLNKHLVSFLSITANTFIVLNLIHFYLKS